MGSKPSNQEVRETTKDFQRSQGEKPDSNSKFSQAEHDARNDYQDSGGDLPNRDRSEK